MRGNQTQSTQRRNAEYAENTREWQKHATVFLQTDGNLALTYWLSHPRAYPRPLRFFFFLRDLCVSSSATSAFIFYRDLCVYLLPHLAKRLQKSSYLDGVTFLRYWFVNARIVAIRPPRNLATPFPCGFGVDRARRKRGHFSPNAGLRQGEHEPARPGFAKSTEALGHVPSSVPIAGWASGLDA